MALPAALEPIRRMVSVEMLDNLDDISPDEPE